MTAANADQVFFVPPGEEKWVALAMLQVMHDQKLIRHDELTVSQALKILGGGSVWKNVSLTRDDVLYLAGVFSSAKNPLVLSTPSAVRDSLQATELAQATALLNYAAGNIDTTVDFSRLHAFSTISTENETVNFLQSITEKDILLILNTNIAFTRPDAALYLKKAKSVIYLTTLPDETAELASWVLPIDSPLESWGEYEPYTGINCLLQPAMGRVFSTKGQSEILLSITKDEKLDFQMLFQERGRKLHASKVSDLPLPQFWNSVLRSGFLVNESKPVTVQLRNSGLKPFSQPVTNTNSLLIWVWPSIMLYDGRLANRGWMQESPEPVSYAVWGSWADIHPETAKKNHLTESTIIKITNNNHSFELPVRITDQIMPGSIALMLGQGHTAPGLNLSKGVGVNVFSIISSSEKSLFGSVSIEATGKKDVIVVTSATYDQYNRDILKTVKLSDLRNVPFLKDEITYPLAAGYSPEHDLYSPHKHIKHRWAMVVDLQRCIGCGACAVACYAENNIPVMGKGPVEKGREMAWLKVVPYFIPLSKSLAWLPMFCQHCDAAPCEPVCPVYASFHNEEGLNAQIYNRCIGTRYCSNNCPYKVRRFNWFNNRWQKPLNLQLNPEVTVRSRGVMEKCTFCVQRIREVEYRAMLEHRSIRDGEIQPACVQSCPTKVYTFGDLLDPQAQVTKSIQCDPRRYQVLNGLNTKPAVIYLKKVVS
jgi:molybdopterin-containing oxidoreductase family iron-sulfur binding subunit